MRFTNTAEQMFTGHEAYKDPRPGSCIFHQKQAPKEKIMAAYLAGLHNSLYFLIGVKLKPSR